LTPEEFVTADTTEGLRHQPVFTPQEFVERHQPVFTPQEFVGCVESGGGCTGDGRTLKCCSRK
jgi:hypothetical protein